MAAAYSMDLRSRVLKNADAGLSSKELAERYHVSRAWGECRDRDRFPRADASRTFFPGLRVQVGRRRTWRLRNRF
jgi:hypothetical protein